MKALKEAVHAALRDDSTATVGLRDLLVQTVTPYGVYEANFPEQPNFKSKSYLTWQMIARVTTSSQLSDLRLREQTFAVTAYSTSPDTVDNILRRAVFVLENTKAVTLPTSDVVLDRILHEDSGPDLFNDKFSIYFRAENFRAFYREDITQ